MIMCLPVFSQVIIFLSGIEQSIWRLLRCIACLAWWHIERFCYELLCKLIQIVISAILFLRFHIQLRLIQKKATLIQGFEPRAVGWRCQIQPCTNSDECMVQLIIVSSFSNYNCEVPPPYTDHNQFCRLQGFLFSMLSSPYRCKLKWLDEVKQLFF